MNEWMNIYIDSYIYFIVVKLLSKIGCVLCLEKRGGKIEVYCKL